MQPFSLSRATQDLIKALAADGTYAAVGTAGSDDGSIVTTITTLDGEGVRHRIDVRISAAP